MLANIVSQTHMLARFAMDSNMLANILDLEYLSPYYHLCNFINNVWYCSFRYSTL